MTTTARHRAPATALHWASRSVVSVVAVPVGALAGCAAATALTGAPSLGLAGMTVAAVPLALHAWHRHRAEGSGRAPGRHTLRSLHPDTIAATGVAGQPTNAAAWSIDADDRAPAGLPALLTRPPAPRRALDAVVGAARAARTTALAKARIDLTDLDIDLRSAQAAGMLPGAPTATATATQGRPPVLGTRAERDAEIARLRQLWDVTGASDTGATPVVASTSLPAPVAPAGSAA